MSLTHTKIWTAIDALARREGLSTSALARRAGLDPTSFNPSKRFGPGELSRPRWPSTESVMRVLDVAGLSLGEFADLADDPAPLATSAPLLGLAQAGADGYFDDAGFPVGEGWDRIELPRPKAGLFGLRIVGDSMTPLYRAGDQVIVDRDAAPPRRGDRVVARLTSGEVMAKEISSLTAKAVTLTSINPAHPPRTVARRDIDWMARILWVSQ